MRLTERKREIIRALWDYRHAAQRAAEAASAIEVLGISANEANQMLKTSDYAELTEIVTRIMNEHAKEGS